MVARTSMELIRALIGTGGESDWLEFKHNNADGQMIGCEISALANAAAMSDRDSAYLIWGVDDATHALVGTSFDPHTAKGRQNQLLLPWLKSQLSSGTDFTFEVVDDELGSFVVLRIGPATTSPVAFQNQTWLRRGSASARLEVGEFAMGELWAKLLSKDFEHQPATEALGADEVRRLIDVETLLSLLGASDSQDGLATLAAQRILTVEVDGSYTITNLGALVGARDLTDFPHLEKRPIRVVHFDGPGSLEIVGNYEFTRGYALALPEAERAILSAIGGRESIDGAFRRVEHAVPDRAVREALVNAVIHQDLSDRCQGPFVSVFSNRIEFANPGRSMVEPEKVLNDLPVTRNSALVRVMRLMKLVEESGSGWDFMVEAMELRHLPAPRMRTSTNAGTVVTLMAEGSYETMNASERLDAAYWHACLRLARGAKLTNASLRERFGLSKGSYSTQLVSRLIAKAVEHGLLKESPDGAGMRLKAYVPFWAQS